MIFRLITKTIFVFFFLFKAQLVFSQVTYRNAIICEAVQTTKGLDAQNCKTQSMYSTVNIDYNSKNINMKLGPNRFILTIMSSEMVNDGLVLYCKDINNNSVDVGMFNNGDFIIRTKSHFITLR
jgi:hypothetical protein